MNAFLSIRQSVRLSTWVGILLGAALFSMPKVARALCGLDAAVLEQLRGVDDLQAARGLSRKVQRFGTCTTCHLARFGGPRNAYGTAINTLLTIRDREDAVRQREVGQRMKAISANPALQNSPTFGELFQLGRYPANHLASYPQIVRSVTNRSGFL